MLISVIFNLSKLHSSQLISVHSPFVRCTRTYYNIFSVWMNWLGTGIWDITKVHSGYGYERLLIQLNSVETLQTLLTPPLPLFPGS